MIFRKIDGASFFFISVFMYQNIFADPLLDARSDSKTKSLAGKNKTLNITVATDTTVEVEKTEKQSKRSKEKWMETREKSVKSNESSGEIPKIVKAWTTVNDQTVTPLNETMRIVGGERYSIEHFPHQAYLGRSLHDEYMKMWCGATIISDRWILTAAHCTVDDNGERVPQQNFTVFVGTDDIETNPFPWYVAHSIVHEGFKYTDNGAINDICLLELQERLSFNERVQPARLAKEDEEKKWVNVRDKVWVSGFGDTKHEDEDARFLRAVSVTIFPQEVCLSNAELPKIPDNEMWLCAGRWSGGKDACSGDSGGPLGVFEGNRFTVLGITSFGDDCGLPKKPGYYTRVSHYLNWIEKMMSKPDNRSQVID